MTTKGSVRWAPFPGGPQKCRVVAHGKMGLLLVRWQGGPLKGKEARIAASSLRQHKRDVACDDPCDDIECREHGIF